jgi:predicted amidohydrolase
LHLTIGLGEYDTGWHDPRRSLAAAARLTKRLAGVGVDVVILPELATTGATTEGERAVAMESEDVGALREMARANNVWLIGGIALEQGGFPACAVNAALAIDPAGEIVATYRKQRLFTLDGEDKAFAPGLDSSVVAINGVRLGMFICYDLRFPEVFAPVAEQVDAMVVIANWPAARQNHWDALLRARAIENQNFVIGVNRTGSGGGLVYAGGSTVFDPWGDRVNPACSSDLRIVSINAAQTETVRREYPFLRDRMSAVVA